VLENKKCKGIVGLRRILRRPQDGGDDDDDDDDDKPRSLRKI
jgi:hypothetical protein